MTVSSGGPVRTYETALGLLRKIITSGPGNYAPPNEITFTELRDRTWMEVNGGWELTPDEVTLVHRMKGTTNGG